VLARPLPKWATSSSLWATEALLPVTATPHLPREPDSPFARLAAGPEPVASVPSVQLIVTSGAERAAQGFGALPLPEAGGSVACRYVVVDHRGRQRAHLSERCSDEPSESHPETGCVTLHGVAVSEAVYFLAEDGEQVLRSTKFDLHGTATTFKKPSPNSSGLRATTSATSLRKRRRATRRSTNFARECCSEGGSVTAMRPELEELRQAEPSPQPLRAVRPRHRPAEAWIPRQGGRRRRAALNAVTR